MKWLTSVTIMLLGSILLPLASSGQWVSGTVRDSTGGVLPGASINLKKTSDERIVAYAITNDKGEYEVSIPAAIPSTDLYVEAHYIGYKTQHKPVGNIPGKIDFILHPSATELEAIVVQTKKFVLRTNGDTLSYNVSDFSNPQDRVIGDVIKRLPGISVASDGTISYNSRPITTVYVGGDNLLDGRYNIATNAIPQGVVSKVQVIDNDQPVKVLQQKLASNEVALNLTFKKTGKQRLFGQEILGAGIPGNYYADLNAMLFNDHFKAINQLAANNTGYGLQRDLVSHTETDYRQFIGQELPQTLLSLGSVNNPDLARNRYLFNHAQVINVNNLVNLKSDWQLRVNAFYIYDRQQQNYSQHSIFYLPGDTVQYTELQDNRFRSDWLHTQFTIQHNTPKSYLKNVLQLDDNQWTGNSALTTNNTLLYQTLGKHSTDFSNELNLITSTRSGHIVQLYSYISHLAQPEKLVIGPDYQSALFNNGDPYEQLVQQVNVPTWYNNNYLSYKIPGSWITQSFRAGFSIQSQLLASGLTPGGDSSVNHLNWNKQKWYGEAAYDIPVGKLKANLSLPLTFEQIDYTDKGQALRKDLTRLYFNPQLQLKYYTSTENFMTVLYNFHSQRGTIEDIYPGYILKDYRTLYANNASLTLQQNQVATIGFNYRKALQLFFWSLNVTYHHNHANNITSAVITNNLQRNITLPYPNNINAWTANGTVSKYSFVLATTFGGFIQWQSSHSLQFQNNQLLPFHTISTSVGISADTKLNDQLDLSYKTSFNETGSHFSMDAGTQHIDQLQQQLTLHYNPSRLLQCKLSGEHYFTRQSDNADLNYFFADASLKYRFNKRKIDLELDANNVLNVRTYNALYLTANTLVANSYTLPGRIILFKVLFNL